MCVCVCCNVLLLMLILVDYADLCIINVRVWRAEVYTVRFVAVADDCYISLIDFSNKALAAL